MKEDKTCTICGKTFTRRNYMKKHMEHIHSKCYSCPKCFRFFSSAAAADSKHSCAIQNGKFLCYVRNCSLKFSNGMSLRLHIRDHHRQMDEDDIDNKVKTKRGSKKIIQTLCKKINLLSRCFDELKYQVDSISKFLKTKDFSFEERKFNGSTNSKTALDDEDKVDYEDIVYIDESFEDEERHTNEITFPQNSSNNVISMPYENQNKLSFKQSENIRNEMPNQIEQSSIPEPKICQSKLLFPSTRVIPLKKLSKEMPSPTIIKRSAHIFSKSNTTKVGSTIITKIPANEVQWQTSMKKPSKAQSTTASTVLFQKNPNFKTIQPSKTATPPLFLNIQYDTEATVCETEDPKITFHFDTEPPP